MRRFVTNDETALAFADKIKHFILLTLQLFRPEEVVEIDGAARRVLDKHDNADTLPGVASCRAGLQALPPFFSSLLLFTRRLVVLLIFSCGLFDTEL